MNTPITPQSVTAQVDPDLPERAVAGHGGPSQNPNPAAQVLLRAEQPVREARSVPMGGACDAPGNGYPEVPGQKP
ncbi:MAG: hypothetical protein ABWY08_16740 [Comamonas sp.]